MDRIQKFLLKLDKNRKIQLLKIFQDIKNLNLKKHDVKALKDFSGLFRLRKGKIRVIFTKQNNIGFIVNVDFRGSIYKNL